MTITVAWTDPSEAGTLDLDTGDTLTDAVWDALVSNIGHLGGTAGLLACTSAGLVTINDTSNAKMTIGLTINQGANDDEALTLKSSDVAHGITDYTETDTYGMLNKSVATTGGLKVSGYSEDAIGIEGDGFYTNDDTARSTSAVGAITLRALKKAGTTWGNPGAGANLLVVSSGTTARFLVDQEGDIYMDATSNINAWDDHDDLALLEAYRALSGAHFRARFAQNMTEHAEVLARTGVLTPNPDGHPFVSLKGLMGLMIDGMRQMGTRLAETEQRLRVAESRLALLPEGGH